MLRLRDFTPRGFYARSLLLVLLPLVLLLIVMTWLFYDSHIQQVSRKMSQSVAGEVAEVTRLLVADTDTRPVQERIRTAEDALRLEVEFIPRAPLPDPIEGAFWRESRDEILRHELDISLGQTPFWFDTAYSASQIEILVQPAAAGDQMLRFFVDQKRAFATTGHNFIAWVAIFSVLLVIITIGFLRNQVKSVLRLATAAEAWGRGEDMADLKPSGATEVRQASLAIRQMRDRIVAHAEQRTAMLAGVSHDLRTPLTRLKLQLALLPPSDDLKAARKDLDEMAAMLDEYLAFARGEEGEAYEDCDLSTITHDAASVMGDRAQLSITALPGVIVRIRPLAIKRALSNLINNAADYGSAMMITVHQDKNMARVTVEDNGPGIPEDRLQDAFKPFVRLDAARNQNIKGVGLGLAIARDVARSHGGDIYLGQSGMGGLKAEFVIPVQHHAIGK
ncbi:ATP-binding protein [Ponticaulis koreensis]|uniref:ATP-binding protein n=1 Tax=Ponticaulis koreensis TaxID=1123045 RepID=UPI0003B486D1|nr:ATP-binding protein [Ponticaulis koreensis]